MGATRKRSHRVLPTRAPQVSLGRNVLYERFFAGDPWRLGSLAATRYPWKDELQERIWAFLRRARQWEMA